MVVKTVNPWSKQGGLEPQRSDLWVVELEQVVNGVRNVPQFAGMTFPDPNTSKYYARQVIFPDISMAAVESKRHSVPIEYPGFDEPIGQVRIDFMVEAGQTKSDGSLFPQQNSRIWNLIRCWHQLARVGRVSRTSLEDGFSIPLQEIATSYASSFKFDVNVNLFSGPDTAPDFGIFGQTFKPTAGLLPTTSSLLKRCWVKAYQIGNLDHEGNAFLKLTVTLVTESIVPIIVNRNEV